MINGFGVIFEANPEFVSGNPKIITKHMKLKINEIKNKQMKLSQVKTLLPSLDVLRFQLPNGTFVPAHFHITEVGLNTKHFIDCGGTVREEKAINFQLWEAEDFDHRLAPQKLLRIIEISEKALNLENHTIEIEYQSDTIGKYGLAFDGTQFVLTTKRTDCLAKDTCGVPEEGFETENACCSPTGGCC